MAADSGNTICTFFYDTPCGRMQLVSAGDRLCLCDWLSEEHHGRVLRRLGKELGGDPREEKSEVISEAMRQLDEYFAKERKEFDLPLMFVGTGFQKSVWNAMLSIPYGKTESYGALAARLGRPTAVRAVAGANGANAISIIVPCHRVIGSDHSLTGYGGGIEAKKYLLELEQGSGTLF